MLKKKSFLFYAVVGTRFDEVLKCKKFNFYEKCENYFDLGQDIAS